ncbi:MAG: hypothetical protein R3C12_18950 [Planctomycetaceae bacterium]
MNGQELLHKLALRSNYETYRQEHWEGRFADYLDIVRRQPKVTRTGWQRLYDMIMQDGTYTVEENREKLTRYKFFDDPHNNGEDAIFGLTRPLMELVNVFRSAALRYGAERRVMLLHGPVGSSKSTIARLLKRGLERYSRTEEGAIYSFGWIEEDGSIIWDPMNGEPLQLIPMAYRQSLCEELNQSAGAEGFEVEIHGDICPLSRYYFQERMRQHQGDWSKVLDTVRVRRIVLSEQDRVGIGTFQPKDEKNQDSTELTGDINYRKIAEYGSESDPRAFNFDGEFNVANRGLIEFIEVLKLDVAFLCTICWGFPGTQDQTEEIRADRYRHCHSRPHE